MKNSKYASLKSKLLTPDVSIVGLDTLKSSQKLEPGQPHSIITGVTLSVLATAAEGLIEIDSASAGEVLVDSKRVSEIATLHPGQIIKTNQGRFVMVRHLQALIVPREAGYTRPESYKNAIILAESTLGEEESSIAPSPKKVELSSQFSTFPSSNQTSKSKLLMRSAIGLVVAGIAAMYFFGSEEQPTSTAPVKNQGIAKSRIVEMAPAAANPESQKTVVEKTTVEKTEKNAVAKAPEVPRTSAVDALRAAAAASPQDSVKQPSAKVAAKSTQKVNPSKLVRLSEQERQTIIELKLEAKFDRSNARAKLKHFANSFPEGSPARNEVLREYNSL